MPLLAEFEECCIRVSGFSRIRVILGQGRVIRLRPCTCSRVRFVALIV
jgi:hypothetical protein